MLLQDKRAGTGSLSLLKEWEEIILDWERSDMTQGNYCKKMGIKFSRFHYWRLKILKRRKRTPAGTPLVASAGRIHLSSPSPVIGRCKMRMFYNDYCLELKDDFSPESLGRLLKVLKDQ